ncbi:MAG: hypothetical protein V4687_11630 [Bacteroidota bacterium]
METNDVNNSNKPVTDDAHFENSDVDPGFVGHQDDKTLTSREDKRENNIDANLSIKEMREGKSNSDNSEEADALNYKNDREHGSFNPKNI